MDAWHADSGSKNLIGHVYQERDIMELLVLEPPVKKQGYYRSKAAIRGVYRKDTFINTTGNVWIYFPEDSHPDSIGYGTLQLVNAPLRSLSEPSNPGGFDFKQYSATQHIHHSIRLKKGQWVCAGLQQGNLFRSRLFHYRQKLLNCLVTYIGEGRTESAIAEALVLGFKDDLDPEILKMYSNTGVVHIIAISGMHLALIQYIVSYLLGLIRLSRYPVAATFLNIISLWLFALLTGGSASILRSAVMFTVLLLGKLLSRNSSIYNSLSASALLMLCYDSCYLWDAGFILSHLAVLGLVVLQRPLQNLFYFKNKWMRKVWEMNAITLSAQLFTLPCCLYLFKQFPNYFLLSNLLVVPLSSLILIAGLLLISLSWCLPVAALLGAGMSMAIRWMNEFVLYMSRLPFSVSNFYQFGKTEMLFLYLLIIFLCLLFIGRFKRILLPAMGVATILSLITVVKDCICLQQQKLVFYSRAQSTALDLFDGNQGFAITDTALLSDTSFLSNVVHPCRKIFGVEKDAGSISIDSCNIFQFAHYVLILVKRGALPDPAAIPAGTRLVLVSDNGKVSLEKIRKYYNPEMVIFDASNKMWKIEKWQSDCEKLHLRNYSIPHRGALVLDAGKFSKGSFHEKNSFGADLGFL